MLSHFDLEEDPSNVQEKSGRKRRRNRRSSGISMKSHRANDIVKVDTVQTEEFGRVLAQDSPEGSNFNSAIRDDGQMKRLRKRSAT